MHSYVVPPLIERKLAELNKPLTTAFSPSELIDILLPEDVAYYIYINQVLQSLTQTAARNTSIYNKVLNVLIEETPIDAFFKSSISDNHYMDKLNRILRLVPNVPYILGIPEAEHIRLYEVLTVEQLPTWFKDQLVETTVGSIDNMQCTDSSQCNLFVLRPVDERFANIALIGADKSTTDHGEFVLSAIDHSINSALRYISFNDLVGTSLFSLFAQLSATYRLL